MHPGIKALVLFIVALVLFVLHSRKNRLPASPRTGKTSNRQIPRSMPSIFEQIVQQLRALPDASLDVQRIVTDDPVPDSGELRFAAGAMEAVLGSGEGSGDAKAVIEVVRQLGRGRSLDWTALDAVTAEAPAAVHVNDLIDHLQTSDHAEIVVDLFWELALKSRRTESVKWGIMIGGIAPDRTKLSQLLILARHAEFTRYVAHILEFEGQDDPAVRHALVDLLPHARSWGVIALIDTIVTEEALIQDPDVQRSVLVYGMENHDGIPIEVAFTIARAIDVPRFIAASRNDARLRRAVECLMDTLLTWRRPLGGLMDLERWEWLYDTWVTFVEQIEPDVQALCALRSLRQFLSEDGSEWSRAAQERIRIEALWKHKFSEDVLRAGFADARDRWLTMQIIEEHEVLALLPEVRRAFAEKPDYSIVSVLAKIGSEDDLEALRVAIDRLVDLEARRRIPISDVTPIGEHAVSMQYGLIVQAMGRLATADAIAAIKVALDDYDPNLRVAGCDAVASLNRDSIDEDIQAAIRRRITDPSHKVVEAAVHAAATHDIER